jgi:tRNA nucleotidyltransferase (CCA-adding enzyme)
MYTNINVPYFMVNVCQQLNKAGYEAFIVGGAVRDFLLGRENFDFDITTSALPDEILSVFPDARTFGSYGTMVINRENMMIEITPFRNDAPGRKPDYSFGGTLYTDLARRDFTINSMAYDPLKE